jgi:hypothetical protein
METTMTTDLLIYLALCFAAAGTLKHLSRYAYDLNAQLLDSESAAESR